MTSTTGIGTPALGRRVGLRVGGGTMAHAPGPEPTAREESVHGAGKAAVHRIVRST